MPRQPVLQGKAQVNALKVKGCRLARPLLLSWVRQQAYRGPSSVASNSDGTAV